MSTTTTRTPSTGDIIRNARTSIGLTQREFVTKTNKMFNNDPNNHISVGHLAEIETGKTGVSIDKLNLITYSLMSLGAK